jgi:hypothetical protein
MKESIDKIMEDTWSKVIVMEHFANGNPVEVRIRNLPDSNWVLEPKPCWDWHTCEFRKA